MSRVQTSRNLSGVTLWKSPTVTLTTTSVPARSRVICGVHIVEGIRCAVEGTTTRHFSSASQIWETAVGHHWSLRVAASRVRIACSHRVFARLDLLLDVRVERLFEHDEIHADLPLDLHQHVPGVQLAVRGASGHCGLDGEHADEFAAGGCAHESFGLALEAQAADLHTQGAGQGDA